jgi:hypothetical protein
LRATSRRVLTSRLQCQKRAKKHLKHFVRWLYSGASREEITPLSEDSECAARIKETIDLYVFADKVGCPALEREMVGEFLLLLSGPLFDFPIESVEYLYGLPINAEPLIEMTVAYYVWEIDTDTYARSKNLQSLLARLPEFTKAVLIEMSTRYGLLDTHSPLDRSMDFYLSKYQITVGRESGGK